MLPWERMSRYSLSIFFECQNVRLFIFNWVGRSADDQSVRRWRRLGEAKIALRVPDLEELHRLARRASEVGLNNFLVADAGCTQLEPGTETVLAIGPGTNFSFCTPQVDFFISPSGASQPLVLSLTRLQVI